MVFVVFIFLLNLQGIPALFSPVTAHPSIYKNSGFHIPLPVLQMRNSSNQIYFTLGFFFLSTIQQMLWWFWFGLFFFLILKGTNLKPSKATKRSIHFASSRPYHSTQCMTFMHNGSVYV